YLPVLPYGTDRYPPQLRGELQRVGQEVSKNPLQSQGVSLDCGQPFWQVELQGDAATPGLILILPPHPAQEISKQKELRPHCKVPGPNPGEMNVVSEQGVNRAG